METVVYTNGDTAYLVERVKHGICWCMEMTWFGDTMIECSDNVPKTMNELMEMDADAWYW